VGKESTGASSLIPSLATIPVGNALRGVPKTAIDAAVPLPGTPRKAFPTVLVSKIFAFVDTVIARDDSLIEGPAPRNGPSGA
jgi:hypothetical protein